MELNQIAKWIFKEWGYVKPENSIESIAKQLSPRCNSKTIPLTLIAIDTEVLGTVSLVENDMKSHPELTPWLGSLYVRSDLRGQGIGELLCRKLLEEAQKLGHKKCYLFTDKQEAFYAKRGWRTILKENYRNEIAFVMEIDL